MIGHEPLDRHRRTAAMVVCGDFCRMVEPSDNACYFPCIAQVFLNHNAYIEAALLMMKQVDSSLNKVAALLLLLNELFKKLIESGAEYGLRIHLESVADRWNSRSINTDDAISKRTVYRLNINYAVIA